MIGLMNLVRPLCCIALAVFIMSGTARAQDEYRNLESGRPVRVSDAIPTERYALDLDLTTVRVERLSLGRYRMTYEPRIAYGIFPRTELSLRMPTFFRERSIVPRRGVAGLGIGTEVQLVQEGLHLPALGVSAEAFVPTGPNSLKTSYSLKGLLTRSFTAGRIHLNGSYGTFAVRAAPTGGIVAPPVIDGPCTFQAPESGITLQAMCGSATYQQSVAASQAEETGIITKYRWNAGLGVDKAFPIRAVLIAADVFVDKYNGIDRDAEWIAEGGIRKQLNPLMVADATFGRRFTGISKAWFIAAGTTFTLPF
jgi:hypothetical protein